MANRPPGLLRSSANPDVVMMVCTAGHVDHGKTRLVRLLTGCNTDRLKEEQERGLTIELGFAPCVLGGDICVGIVDVPGHEKFVRNMVAGVSGIGMTILVIAADDGIMPQTIEHFQIMELLGVRRGIIVITKIDLVTPERVEEVREDIEVFVAGTFLEDAPVYAVSSETGEGIFDFYEGLQARVGDMVRQRKRGIFRMPVERVFVQKGFGAVVTGIPVDGTVRVGDEVELQPGGGRGRVRGLQRFLRNAEEGSYGQCLALNVSDFGRDGVERGQVVCHPGYLRSARQFYVDLKTVTGLSKPLEHGENIKLHTGTAERSGKVFLFEDKVVQGGARALAAITLADPVAAAVHDRFILRRPSPAVTVAGGEVLALSDDDTRKRKSLILDPLRAYRDLFEGVDPASPEGIDREVAWCLRFERNAGATVQDIARGALIPEAVVAESAARQSCLRCLAEGFYVHGDAYAERLGEAEARVKAVADAKKLSIPLADLRKGFDWPAPLIDAVMADLTKAGHIAVRGDRVVMRDALSNLPDADRALMERIYQTFEEGAWQSPRPEELPDLLNAPMDRIERLLHHLCAEGSLVRLAKNVVLSYNAYRRAQDIVVRTIQEKGALDSADFKYAIGSTRKYALAILDFLDSRRVTVRSGNVRKLAAQYERNLL